MGNTVDVARAPDRPWRTTGITEEWSLKMEREPLICSARLIVFASHLFEIVERRQRNFLRAHVVFRKESIFDGRVRSPLSTRDETIAGLFHPRGPRRGAALNSPFAQKRPVWFPRYLVAPQPFMPVLAR
jgi:hypothetical protein